MNKVIKYVKGDINQLVGEGDKIITFVCIDNKNLGKVDFIDVDDNTTIANMIVQKDTLLIKYGALRACLAIVNDRAFKTNATIHIPKFQINPDDNNWKDIEKIIQDVMSVDVIIYDLN